MNYDGNEWGHQGPTRVTSVLELFCKNFNSITKWPNGSSAKDAVVCIPKNETTKQSVAVLNSKYAYPFKVNRWRQQLLSEAKCRQSLHQLKEDKTFAIHLWNNITKGNFENITSPHSAYAAIVSRHCQITSKESYFITDYNLNLTTT